MALPGTPTGGANQVTYASGVASYLAQVIGWDPSWSLEVDDAAPEKLRRDPVVAGALDHLQRLIVGHDWWLEEQGETKDDRRLATVLTDLQKQTYRLTSALYNMSAASFLGSTWGLIRPERRVLKIGDGKPREWTVVARVRDVDKRRFRLSRIDAPAIPVPGGDPSNPRAPLKTRDQEALAAYARHGGPSNSVGGGAVGLFRWEFHPGFDYRPDAPKWWAPLSAVAPDRLWVQHVTDDSERGLGYGYGMCEDVWTYFWMKQQVLKWGMQGAERWGQGFLVYEVDPLLDGYSKGTSQGAAFTAAINNIRKWRSENFAAINKGDKLTLMDMPAAADQALREWVRYFDGEIVKRILAALQPTGGADGAGGGYSSAKVEEGSTDAMVSFLRCPLEETWTRGVLRFLVEENQDNLAEIGLAGLETPRLRLRGREHQDLDQVIKLLAFARDAGAPVREEDFYSLTGLTRPNEEDRVMVWAPKAAPSLGADPTDPFALLGGDRAAVGEGGTAVGDGEEKAA